MKKLLLGILLGFALNSGLRAVHNYLWWSTQWKISNADMNESFRKHKYYKVVEERRPVIAVLKYLLVYVTIEERDEAGNYKIVIKYP